MSTNAEIEVEDEQESATGGRKMDRELKGIAALLRILDEHDEPARGRMVRYLSDRYIQP